MRKPAIVNFVRTIQQSAAIALVAIGVVACQTIDEMTAPPEAPPKLEASEPTPDQQFRLDTAQSAADSGDYETALGLFQDILAENPTITTAYLGIGDIYMDTRDYDKAEPAFARAARLEPRNFDAQYGHALALQMLGRLVAAVRAYHRALTIDPESPDANLNLATTYIQMKDARRAAIFAERAVEVAPENGPARANLGAIYEELGQFSKAVDAYIVALELMGNHPPLMLNLINVLAKENRYQEAVNTAENLIRIEASAEAYDRLGWCAFKLRDYDRSINAYRESVQYDPDYWPALNGIAVNSLNKYILSKQQDQAAFNEAREAFRRSLRVNPGQGRVIKLMLDYKM